MMHRRTFISSCVSGTVAAAVAHAQPRPTSSGTKAVAALAATKQLEASGDIDKLTSAYHSDALMVEPGSLEPNVGRAAIVDNIRKGARLRKLLYFYYRQPETLLIGNAAIVVSNYEAGYDSGGQTVEDSGKTSNVVMVGLNPPLITLEVVVPNVYAGSYGPLGRALTRPHFGLYPLRALGPAPVSQAKTAGGGENDVLFTQVTQINDAWVSGNANDLLRRADKSDVFLLGDYSPFYIAGIADVKQHFADFYRTSKVKFVHAVSPIVKIWGDTAAVAFNFDLDYTVNGTNRRSPGRGVYTFTRRRGSWVMAACAASHLVVREIGDPYPIPAS
jgi:hypothetical protein